MEFHNILYWFDEKVINNLSRLTHATSTIENDKVKNFFNVAFSETIRRVSKTRFYEFKLLRKKKENDNIDVLRVLQEITFKSIGLLTDFYKRSHPRKITLRIEERNILNGIPFDDGSIDLVITSQSYGDSRATVAYGQFSRLSLRGLGLEENVDRTSLGAKSMEISNDLPFDLLYKCKIGKKD